MYGLAKGTDLSLLSGREVIQVSVGTHQVQLALFGDITVSCEGEITVGAAKRTSGRDAAHELVELLGAIVEHYRIPGNGDLELEFSGGRCLTLHESSERFECYSIVGPGKHITV